MFTVDEPTAEAIRRAVEDGGELAGVVERRYFPLINDNANARRCVRVIAGWTPPADPRRTAPKRANAKRADASARAIPKLCRPFGSD
jgi:hypothetical protein